MFSLNKMTFAMLCVKCNESVQVTFITPLLPCGLASFNDVGFPEYMYICSFATMMLFCVWLIQATSDMCTNNKMHSLNEKMNACIY